MADDKEKTEGLEDQEKSSELSGAEEDNNVHSVNNEIAKKRGRMVAAGVVVSVALCVIAILVAAIFNMTVSWFDQCPEDVAINDPAPVLWNKLVADKSVEAEKGLPESLKKYGSLKSSGN